MKRNQLFEKYKKEHSEFKNADFGNIDKNTDCDELIVAQNEDGYVFNYVLLRAITAKVFYNKNFEIHNEKGPAIMETNINWGLRGNVTIYLEDEKIGFYKNGECFGFINEYKNKKYAIQIWNNTFENKIRRLRSEEKLKQCLEIAKQLKKYDTACKIEVKLVTLSLTKT